MQWKPKWVRKLMDAYAPFPDDINRLFSKTKDNADAEHDAELRDTYCDGLYRARWILEGMRNNYRLGLFPPLPEKDVQRAMEIVCRELGNDASERLHAQWARYLADEWIDRLRKEEEEERNG